MNRDRISAALAEVFDPSSPRSRSSVPGDPALLGDVIGDERSEWLWTLLSQEAPFNEAAFLLSDGTGGALGFGPSHAAGYLMRRVQDGRTCDEAVTDLHALLNVVKAECLAVLALWGVEVAEPIDLGGSLALVPFASVPDSRTKGWIEQASAQHAGPFYQPTLFRTPPTCAFCYTFTASPVLFRGNSGPPQGEKPSPLVRLAEVALPLSLVGPSSPVAGPSWTQYQDPNIERAKIGVTFSTGLMDIMPHPFGEVARLQPELVREVVGNYLSTTGSVRERLRRSLTRFNRAMRWRDSGDKALDLAIALEALLTDGAGENTFKTALRAGLLTEGSTSERVRARAIVSAVYSVRSAVVHDGVTPTDVKVRGAGTLPTDAVVDEAARVAAAILRRIARERQIPSWQEFDLGAFKTSVSE